MGTVCLDRHLGYTASESEQSGWQDEYSSSTVQPKLQLTTLPHPSVVMVPMP